MIKDTELCKETYEMTKEELAAFALAQINAKNALKRIATIVENTFDKALKLEKGLRANLKDRDISILFKDVKSVSESLVPSLNMLVGENMPLEEIDYMNLDAFIEYFDKMEKFSNTFFGNKTRMEFSKIFKLEDGKTDVRDEVRKLVQHTLVNTNANKAIKQLEKKARLNARNEAKKAALKETAPKGRIIERDLQEAKVLTYAQKVDFVRLTLTECHKNYIDGTDVAFDMRRKGDEAGFKTMWNKLRDLNDKVIDRPWAREIVEEDEYGLPVYEESGLVKIRPLALTEANLENAEKDIAKATKVIRVVADAIAR